jgi:hypothetical protein
VFGMAVGAVARNTAQHEETKTCGEDGWRLSHQLSHMSRCSNRKSAA